MDTPPAPVITGVPISRTQVLAHRQHTYGQAPVDCIICWSEDRHRREAVAGPWQALLYAVADMPLLNTLDDALNHYAAGRSVQIRVGRGTALRDANGRFHHKVHEDDIAFQRSAFLDADALAADWHRALAIAEGLNHAANPVRTTANELLDELADQQGPPNFAEDDFAAGWHAFAASMRRALYLRYRVTAPVDLDDCRRILDDTAHTPGVGEVPVDRVNRARAVAELLLAELHRVYGDNQHVGRLSQEGLTVAHPMGCRPDLFACDFAGAPLQAPESGPVVFGRFAISLDNNGRIRLGALLGEES